MNNIGHNNPPSAEEIFAERISDNHSALLEEANKLANAKAKPCDSDDYAERLTNYIKRINTVVKALEAVRVDEKEPVLRQGKIIDAFFKNITNKLDQSKRDAQKPLTAWMQKKAEEEQRLRREAAEQMRRDAEAKAADAARLEAENKVEQAEEAQAIAERIEAHAINVEASAESVGAQMVQVKSDKGGSASLRTRWIGEIYTFENLDLEKLRPYLKPEHLQMALNAFVAAGGRDLTGANIKQISEATVR